MANVSASLHKLDSAKQSQDFLRRKMAKRYADLHDSSSGKKTFNYKGAFNSAAQSLWRYGTIVSTTPNIVV